MALSYGDPRSTCPNCGARFNNTWTIELAFLPKEWYEKHHRKAWMVLLLLLWPAALIPFIGKLPKEPSWLMGAIIVSVMVVYATIYIIFLNKTTRISVKETGFDRAYEQSAARLSNPEYKQHLIDCGYYKEMMRNIRN